MSRLACGLLGVVCLGVGCSAESSTTTAASDPAGVVSASEDAGLAHVDASSVDASADADNADVTSPGIDASSDADSGTTNACVVEGGVIVIDPFCVKHRANTRDGDLSLSCATSTPSQPSFICNDETPFCADGQLMRCQTVKASDGTCNCFLRP